MVNFSDQGRGDVYGGVVRDFTEAGRLLEHTPGSAAGPLRRACDVALAASFYTLDVPFSFLADTLTLPVTLPSALTREDRPAAPKSSYKDSYSPSRMPVLIPNVDSSAPGAGDASSEK